LLTFLSTPRGLGVLLSGPKLVYLSGDLAYRDPLVGDQVCQELHCFLRASGALTADGHRVKHIRLLKTLLQQCGYLSFKAVFRHFRSLRRLTRTVEHLSCGVKG
jgi:hypothetical protein